MNQPAQNPPSRMTKEELRLQNEKLAKDAEQLGIENQRMLEDLARLRAQSANQAPNSTTAIAETGERDPVTGKLLVPPLSQEELDAQDAAIGNEYEEMMNVPEAPIPEPIQPVQTSRAARVAPAIIRPSMETDERDTGFHGKIQQFSDNRLGDDKLTEFAREKDVLAAKQKATNLDFMRQMVTIHIHNSTDPQADPKFSIGVNGRQWSFERNKEYTVPRYVVEGLLRAKPMTYRNEEYINKSGERDVRWPIQQGCRYPFAIVADRYPHWRQWMAFTMAQPD